MGCHSVSSPLGTPRLQSAYWSLIWTNTDGLGKVSSTSADRSSCSNSTRRRSRRQVRREGWCGTGSIPTRKIRPICRHSARRGLISRRRALDFHEDGTLTFHDIAPADGLVKVEGYWFAEDDENVFIRFNDPQRSGLALRIDELGPDKLLVKRFF